MKLMIFILVSILFGLIEVQPARAQESQLTQEIKPIECVYTTIEDGTGTTTNSSCDGQPIPVVTEIIVNKGRPILRGEYSATRAIALRVWLNGQWFTLGVDSRLTTEDDAWLLDLSDLTLPLQSGLYTVIVEIETSDGLLLRNTNAGSFIVPIVQQPTPSQPPNPTPSQPGTFQPGIVIPTILPRTQEAAKLPGNRVPALPNVDTGHGHDAIDTVNDDVMFGLYSVLIIGLLGAILWLIRLWRSHH